LWYPEEEAQLAMKNRSNIAAKAGLRNPEIFAGLFSIDQN